mmetsp:Transcript_7337/g.13032  ORF Transcript_7337/g.13032 Transcript_7337/m.13032 type:complete len:85 (-) Transcript_7337:263-517(-)
MAPWVSGMDGWMDGCTRASVWLVRWMDGCMLAAAGCRWPPAAMPPSILDARCAPPPPPPRRPLSFALLSALALLPPFLPDPLTA